MIHRDVKCLNYSITENWTVKLSDFGSSNFDTSKKDMNQDMGTALWCAPEVLRSGKYSRQSDSYSLGIVMWEIFMEQTPFANYSVLEVIRLVVEKDLRPIIPEKTPAVISTLLSGLWSGMQEGRPTPHQTEEILEQLQEDLGEDSYLLHTGDERIPMN